jgi:hypothetical protein
MEIRSSNCPNDAKVVQAFMEQRIEERIAKHKTRDERKKVLKNVVLVSAAVGALAMAVGALRRR